FTLSHHSALPILYALSLHDALPISGEPGGDRSDLPVVLSCGVEVATPADPESLQPPGYRAQAAVVAEVGQFVVDAAGRPLVIATDRKSTRLNSSHVSISYAVFCLKK